MWFHHASFNEQLRELDRLVAMLFGRRRARQTYGADDARASWRSSSDVCVSVVSGYECVGVSGCEWVGVYVRGVLRGVLRLAHGMSGESSPEDVPTVARACCRRSKNGESSPDDVSSAFVSIVSACDGCE